MFFGKTEENEILFKDLLIFEYIKREKVIPEFMVLLLSEVLFGFFKSEGIELQLKEFLVVFYFLDFFVCDDIFFFLFEESC